MGEAITRNSAKCKNCGAEIESFHRHDFKWCMCGKESNRILYAVPESKMYTKKGAYKKSFTKLVGSLHGIFVDGGKEYIRHGWYNENDYENTSTGS